jgi:hypothetical protein
VKKSKKRVWGVPKEEEGGERREDFLEEGGRADRANSDGGARENTWEDTRTSYPYGALKMAGQKVLVRKVL